MSDLAERLRDACFDSKCSKVRREAADELERLRAELERERMRLAACGVVAIADTPESAAKARDMHPDYRSASCDDVARRVDECIRLRAELATFKAEDERNQTRLELLSERAERAEAERDALSALSELHARDRDKAIAERDALHADFTALQKAIVGNTGASAILTVDALRKDAERLDWLRNHTIATGLSRWMGRHQFLDAAIDAAMREGRGEMSELVERLRRYNPPDRTVDEERQIAQDIHDAADEIERLRADAQMLDWLEKHCTGASDSERHLPFRIYWKHKGIRRAIGDAMKESSND